MSKKKERFEKHHKLPQAQGGTDDPTNISYVSRASHIAFHTLFPGNLPIEKIVKQLNRKWIRPDKMLIIVDRKLPDPNQLELLFK